jgi:hypothetical protein
VGVETLLVARNFPGLDVRGAKEVSDGAFCDGAGVVPALIKVLSEASLAETRVDEGLAGSLVGDDRIVFDRGNIVGLPAALDDASLCQVRRRPADGVFLKELAHRVTVIPLDRRFYQRRRQITEIFERK